MVSYWWPEDRKIRKYQQLGDFRIEPYGEKFFALYKGDELICVTVYKCGAIEVMRRLYGQEG